ncbi:glycoside hydrolase domain-containing protein [Arachidicoccus ginsenosidivorans]|nr:glycoside hydrolase domain-containing protein [Arachidicoccus ginsenosidivorans]
MRRQKCIIRVCLAGMVSALLLLSFDNLNAQSKDAAPVDQVNVFLGSSGDHGQLSPAASYPFSMLSIVPQTDPWIHTGYEFYAKEFLGFAHSVFEGVGCEGSGANLLIKPFLGVDPMDCHLMKTGEAASPGFYSVAFKDGIKAAFTVSQKEGVHAYQFPDKSGDKNGVALNKRGLYFDLSHTRSNRFAAEEHRTDGTSISGWIEAGTTCSVGRYKIYYFIRLSQPVDWEELGHHKLVARLKDNTQKLMVRIGWSSTSAQYAKASISHESFDNIRRQTAAIWNKALSRIWVSTRKFSNQKVDSIQRARRSLFYSLLYRVIQSPYMISEKDGHFRNTKGEEEVSSMGRYNGWSVWDNYRTQLPLLSLAYGNRYQGMVTSLVGLYKKGKKDYATKNEPSNTVRTEHTDIVLLDAYHKGYQVDFASIIDSIKKEVDGLDFSHPDKALESSYDNWALGQIYKIMGDKNNSKIYTEKALGYKTVWQKEFADLSKSDIDRMGARGMYQGTVWQYRWLVPYDMQGMTQLIGSPEKLEDELDRFFDGNYYSQANEPDIAAPSLYNTTAHPSKAQALMHRYAVDTVTQFYFNGNSRGINPIIGPVYQNKPRAFLPTMDDDGGAMSGWFVFAGIGLFPALVGEPVYYLHVPLFEDLTINVSRASRSDKDPEKSKTFHIHVNNFAPDNCYIQKLMLNGRELKQNYLTDQQLRAGGTLVIYSSDKPADNRPIKKWISAIQN